MDYYQDNAQRFVDDTSNVSMDDLYQRLLTHLPQGAKILDAGCGSARDAAAFYDMGYQVQAFDASQALVDIANTMLPFDVQLATFESFSSVSVFDAIWACASLLHVPYAEHRATLTNLISYLSPDGVLYASYKLGNYEGERNGRFFCDMTLERVEKIMNNLPLELVDHWVTGDKRPGRENQQWLNLIYKKNK